MTTTLRWIAGASAAMAIAAAGCARPSPEEVETETVIPVTTALARLGTTRAVIHATGDVNPAPGAELIVVAPEAARVTEITKGEGDRVRRGEVLVRFEIPTLNADVLSKDAEAKAAEARVQNARDNQARLRDLFDRGVAARKEVEDATREVADAQAVLEQAQAAGGAARTLASRQSVAATFDGVVAKRFHNPGDLVDRSSSDPVLRVIDPARLQVDASVAIADLSRVMIGAIGRLILPGEAEPLPLKVISTPAAIEPGTASAPVRLSFGTPHRLAAGTPVEVEIDAEQHANVVLVPAAAIVREGDETAVFVVSDGKAHRRPVVLGIIGSVDVEIRDGVKPGEDVIVSGHVGLPDAATISTEKPVEQPAAEK